MFKNFLCLLITGIAGLLTTAYSQQLISQNAAVKPIAAWYDSQISTNSRIYTGSEYAIVYDKVVDHQFLMQGWEEGTIVFLGRRYDDLEVKYDIVNDQVVFKFFDPSDGRMIALRPAQEKVHGFDIGSRQFRYLPTSAANEISAGFFEVLFDSEYKLFIKHTKEQFIDKSRGAPVVGFLYKSRIYLQKEGTYYYIRNRRALLKLLEDEKKALKTYAYQQNLIWKQNPRRSAALLVNRYLQLKQEDSKK